MLEVQQVFRKHFGHPPTYTVQAPGQIDLLGNPTDSNQGLVLAMAMDHAAFVSTSARTDGRVQLISSLAPTPESFSVLDDARSTAAFWTDSIKSTLSALRQRQAHCSGFNAAIHESIPADTTPVNRAALTVATALAVRELHPFTLTPTGVTVPPRRAKDGSLPPLSTAEKIEMAKVCQIGRAHV